MIRAALFLLFLMVSSAVSAQVPVVPKDGEDDVAVDPAGAAPCPLISLPIRFCGTSPEFVLTPQNDNGDISSYFATPEEIQAFAIIEPLGLRDGLTIPGLQEAALEILSTAAGQPAASFPILERATLPVSGQARPNFVYSGVVEGTPFVYSNTMILFDATVAQLVTVEVGVTTYSPRHRDVHTRYLAHIQVMP